MTHPPKSLQPFLWSTAVNLLDLKRDKSYIIHQLLLYGTFKELRWLFTTYPKREIVDVFIHQPIRMYPRDMYVFVKNHLLSLFHVQLDEHKYVTSISGPVKPRAADRLT
ncbi:hypothetical protein HY950_02985 [Candidatus Gottesmanbacteria bacterium]|nr:hypothetical protein [Candidatus Gottesmanbacteria bacterium]